MHHVVGDRRRRTQQVLIGKLRAHTNVDANAVLTTAERLITDVGGAYAWTDINTVLTGITYDLGHNNQPGTTTIETSYTYLDFG